MWEDRSVSARRSQEGSEARCEHQALVSSRASSSFPMQGPGEDTNTTMNPLAAPATITPLGPEGESFQHKALASVVHGAGAVSASSSSASTRDDEKSQAPTAPGGLLVAASSSDNAAADAPMEEDARIMIDFLQELTSPDRMARGPGAKKAAPSVVVPSTPQQQQQQQAGAEEQQLPPVPVFDQPPRRSTVPNDLSPAPTTARAPVRDEPAARLHPPAFLFPSSRQTGSSPPPTTFRITIKDGVVQRHDYRQPESSAEQPPRQQQQEAGGRGAVLVESETPRMMGHGAPPATVTSSADEANLYSNEAAAEALGALASTEALAVEQQQQATPMEVDGSDDSHLAPRNAHQPPRPMASNAQRGPPLMGVKRYPLPDVRPVHSAAFRAPLGLSSPAHHQQHDDYYHMNSSSGSNNSASRDRLPFTMPSRGELSGSGLSGQPYATERAWEHRADPTRVRRPPHVHPPHEPPPGSSSSYRGASSGRMGAGSPIFFEVSSGRRGEWEGERSYTPNGPQHFFRKPSEQQQQQHYGRPGYAPPQQRGSASASTYFSPNSSLDSFPSSTELSRSNNGGKSGGGGQWDLFNELVNQAERAERELERKEREAEREEYRKYNCGWHRVGYYRKCQEAYGDPRLYDSEDEDYEDPHETGWASYTDGPVPPPRDFQRVRDRMLQIDSLIKGQPAGKPMPKFNSTQWKTVRRRETRRGGGKKERTNSYAYDPSDVQTPPRKKTPAEKVRGNAYYANKGKQYKTQPGVPAIRLPGQAPKRQSTALKDSYDIMADGSIKCRRCGKMGFVNELALRSHLSHCPGTIKMKEARMAKEAALYAAMAEAARENGQLTQADIAKVTKEVDTAAANGTLPPYTPSRDGGAAAAFLMMEMEGDDTKLPSHPPMYLGKQASFDSSGRLSPPVMIVPAVDDGIPLVPGTIQNGEDICKKRVSFRNRLVHGWTDVNVLNYRSRRNSHLIQYSDNTAEWVVLTDQNTCLEPGYRGSHQAGDGAAQDPDTSYSSSSSGKLPASHSAASSSHFQGARGASSSSQSGDSSSDDGQGSSSKRRSMRFEGSSSGVGVGLGPSASYEAGASSSMGTNDFFKRQEELLARSNKKRKAGEEGGMLQDDQVSVSDMSDAGGPVKVTVRVEDTMDSDGHVRKVMRVQPPQRSMHPHHHHHQHHHPAPMAQYTPPRPAKSPYTGMTVRNTYGNAPSPATNSFPCRRCLMLFHNKQALGWHTRKGCVGPVPSQQAPPQQQAPLGPPPMSSSSSSDLAYGASSSSLSKAPSSSSLQQPHGNKRTYEDMVSTAEESV